MKAVADTKLHPETSQKLKDLKRDMGLKSKEAVIIYMINKLDLHKKERIDTLLQLKDTEKIQPKQPEEKVKLPITNVRKMSIVPEILNFNEIKFFDENDLEVQVAIPSKSKYFYPFKKPYIIIDKFASQTTRPEDIRTIQEIGELKKMGFYIYSVKVRTHRKFRKGQQVVYKLRKINDPLYNSKLLNHIPTNHKLQEDINNRCIRICGKNVGGNGIGEWLNISEGKSKRDIKKIQSSENSVLRRISNTSSQSISIDKLKAEIFGIEMINPNKRYKKIGIIDIPIMITKDNQILCIPNTPEIKHIGITGMTGTCKTILMNSILGWDYWQKKKAGCVNLNDFQKETFEWSLPTDSFLYNLKKINIKPCPSPIVYVFPSTETLQIGKKDKIFPYLKMALPMGEVIENIERYYDLDKSKVYLGNLKEELIDCTSIGEIRAVLEENIHPKHVMMKYKLMNIFEALFNNNMLNVSVPDAAAFLEYKNKYENQYYNFTIQTLLRANIIPSIQTSDLRNQEYFSAYMSFIVDSLYKSQYEDPYFKNRSISLFVDEIDKLWLGHNGDLIKKALNLIGTNGRTARIGLRWSTQHYGKVPDQIRGNTKYLFVSRKSHAKEVNEIKRDFNMPRNMEKDILGLKIDPRKELFEIVALTTERFILYDLITGKKTYSYEAHKGNLLCPMAMHHRPDHEI